MAITVVGQTIHNGSRNLVRKFTFAGTTGDVTVLSLVDASAFSATNLKIMKIHASLSGFSAALVWDATANVDAVGLAEGETTVDYTDIGGLPNNGGTGVTGDILIRTDGYTAAAGEDNGYIILSMKKS